MQTGKICKAIKTPKDKHTSARIDTLSPDQQQVETSPAESPAVATAKINRVATNIFILKRKGMPANHKTKQRSHDQRKRVRESVTRGEGVSTPSAHRTRWYPRMCLNLWVCNKSTLIWTKMNAECREKKGLNSHGPYPAAYVSVLRNQRYRSSANYFLFVLCFLGEQVTFTLRCSTFGGLCW